MIAKRTSKCRVCRGEYSKRSMTHRACSIECSLVLVAKEKQSKEKKTDKLRKEAIKSLSDLKREAQTESDNLFVQGTRICRVLVAVVRLAARSMPVII